MRSSLLQWDHSFIPRGLRREFEQSLPSRAGMSNMRPAGRMRPFASTPAARTRDTVIWSFNGQNCSFYNLNWINVRRSQKNNMFFFIQNVFYTWKHDRLFPSVKIFIKWLQLVVVRGPHDNTNVTQIALGGPSVWHAWSRAPYTPTWCAQGKLCLVYSFLNSIVKYAPLISVAFWYPN